MTLPLLVRAIACATALVCIDGGVSAAEPIAAGEIAKGGDLASVEVTSASRKGDVLTVALRFRADRAATGTGGFTIYGSADQGYDSVYLVAGDRKYFAMKDAEGRPLMPENFVVSIDRGKGLSLWTARFAAPPPDVKEFSLVLPLASPLESIPITDK